MADMRTYKENSEVKTKVGPHTFRHTADTNLIAGDFDIVVVQLLLGHRVTKELKVSEYKSSYSLIEHILLDS